jgi:hypothetical protein
MRNGSAVLKMGLRAAVWKATPAPASVGLAALVGWFMLAVAAEALSQYVAAAGPRFDVYGVTALMGWNAVVLVITAFFVRPDRRMAALAAMLVISIAGAFAYIAIHAMTVLTTSGKWTELDEAKFIFYPQIVWWMGSMFAILRSVEPERGRGRLLLRTAGLWVAIVAACVVFPHEPAFRGRDFDIRTANWWEYITAALEGRLDNEEPRRPVASTAHVQLLQPALLDAAVANLAPQRPGVTDVYTIGIAGWAEQDVFIKELNGGLDSLAHRLPTENRVLRLVNHPDTVLQTPIASRQNFAAAVRAVARVMDRDEDVLLLFVTSHGGPWGVALQLWGLAHSELSPEDVATVLDEAGIKNRILIVSACYSGVFAKPLLADENSIILTAADESHSSFGCSNEREWTYFGDALFNRGLTQGRDLEHAFTVARDAIAEWEARDNLTPSNPQAHFGAQLMQRIAPLYRPDAGTGTQALSSDAAER